MNQAMRKNIIAVVGNPNCGKTTLFNGLTGSHQTVGNWPGVTVERIVGEFTYKDREITIVDLPGIYSLQPSSASSEDERVARDYILQDEAELIVNIVDASNLERNLYLTTQLLEMQVPMIVVLNMLDMAAAHQIEIDPHKLSEALGCPVIGIVASKEQGLKELCAAIDAQLDDLRIPKNPIVFADDVEEARAKIAKLLSAQKVERAEWTAEQLLEGDAGMGEYLKGVDLSEVDKIIAEINQKYNGDLDIAMADVRYSFVSQATAASMIRKGEIDQSTTDKIDKFVLNRWLGIPIFLFIMYLMFIFSINIGSAFIDFFDILFGAIFVQGFGNLLTSIGSPEWLKTILADGIGGGIQTVSTFIPVIACLFLSLSFLEDSGYMARAAFVMEIPPYHLPTLKNLGLRTWDRLKSFIIKAGQLIVIIVAVLAFLNSLGTDGSFGNEDTDKSVLSQIGKTIVPAFQPMGISNENWPAAVGVFTGILAKEAVVGTLDSLYSGMGDRMSAADQEKSGEAKPEEEEEPFSLSAEALKAVKSVGENLSELGDFFVDPLGVSVEKDLTDVDEQAAEQEVGTGTFRAMKHLFDGDLGAFSYLLMVLLYIPCCASIGAMYREVGVGWTTFAALWTIAMGYGTATIVYQIGRFSQHPVYSSICIGVCLAVILSIVIGLRIKGKEAAQ